VSISAKLKWLQLWEDYRHLHNQLELTQEFCRAIGPEFQQYYEEFCAARDLDLNKLNQDHRQHLDQLYGIPSPPPSAGTPSTQASAPPPGALVLFDGIPTDEPVPVDWSKEEKEIHEIFSKLFKKIASFIHPDKLETMENENEKARLTKLFKKVRLGLEKRRYFILLEAAEELGIDTPKDYRKQSRWIKNELRMLSTILRKERSTYNYRFGELETDEERDNLMRQFIHQLFGLSIN